MSIVQRLVGTVKSVPRYRTPFSPAERRQIACARMTIELVRYASGYQATDSDVRELVATMLAESNGLDYVAPTNKKDGSRDWTIWQHNDGDDSRPDRLVGQRVVSTFRAWDKFRRRGLKPWYASPKRHHFYAVVDEAMRLERLEDGKK